MSTILVSILTFSAALSAFYFYRQKEMDLKYIDRELLHWVDNAKESLPKDYHDKIVDKSSIPKEQYDAIVDKNNRHCIKGGLQYIWSVLVLDPEKIVFTTATSPGHNITKQDHAEFFEVHRDPGAFSGALKAMEPHFSSFKNEWGYGRMVLVPEIDSRGRVFMFGASISIDNIIASQRRIAFISLTISCLVLLIGFFYSLFLSGFIAKPINELSRIAGYISEGHFDHTIKLKGASELKSLSAAINHMSQTIKKNISDLKNREEELKRHRQHLQELVEERTTELGVAQDKLISTEKLAALGKLAGMVGHELRNPLGVIRNSAYFLKMKLSGSTDDEKIRKHINILEEEVERSDRIINDILTYGRIKEPSKINVDLNKIAKKVVERLHLPKGIIFDFRPGAKTGEIMADENQMIHLFNNIILNAIDAMGKQGTLSISTLAKSGNLEIRIKDTGIGIPSENIDKVLDPGFSTKAHGAGLGLAICESIVTLHNGEIYIASETDNGTEVVILLPFK